MHFLKMLFVLLVLGACHARRYPTDRFSTPFSKPKVARRCGDRHNALFGTVYYKPFQQVLDNERCVWIIGVPSALGYNVTVQYLGSPTNNPPSGQELLLTGVAYDELRGPPIMTTKRPGTVGTYTFENVNLVVVTFASGNQTLETSTGFSLQYEALLTGNGTQTSLNSTHNFLESPLFEFHYPVESHNYDAFELTSFVFAPTNNFYTGGQKYVYYKQDRIESYDTLNAYKFNKLAANTDQKWEYAGQICDCGGSTYEHVSHDDLMLIFFQTDYNGNYAGFWFWFTGC